MQSFCPYFEALQRRKKEKGEIGKTLSQSKYPATEMNTDSVVLTLYSIQLLKTHELEFHIAT